MSALEGSGFWGGGCLVPRGVSGPRGSGPGGVCVVQGGVWSWGVSASVHAGIPPPPVKRILDTRL